MVIELARNPSGGFLIKAREGRRSEILGEGYRFLEEARRFALPIASKLGCSLINSVSDDVPATHLSRTRKGI